MRAYNEAIMAPRVLKVVTEALNPPWVGAATLGAVAYHGTAGVGDFFKWWAVSGSCLILAPLLYLVVKLLRRQLTSGWYLTNPTERLATGPAGVALVVAGLVLLAVLGAPHAVVAVGAAMLAAMGVLLVLVPRWKISAHCGSLAGAVAILVMVYGWWAVLLAILLPAAAWARVKVAHHTWVEGAQGTLVGVAIAGSVFGLIYRLW